MEHLDLRSSSTQTKILGTIVSILGALVMVFYKGPTILSSSATPESSQSLHFSLRTSQTNWTKGGLLLVADKLLISIALVLQAIKFIVEFSDLYNITNIDFAFLSEGEQNLNLF